MPFVSVIIIKPVNYDLHSTASFSATSQPPHSFVILLLLAADDDDDDDDDDDS